MTARVSNQGAAMNAVLATWRPRDPYRFPDPEPFDEGCTCDSMPKDMYSPCCGGAGGKGSPAKSGSSADDFMTSMVAVEPFEPGCDCDLTPLDEGPGCCGDGSNRDTMGKAAPSQRVDTTGFLTSEDRGSLISMRFGAPVARKSTAWDSTEGTTDWDDVLEGGQFPGTFTPKGQKGPPGPGGVPPDRPFDDPRRGHRPVDDGDPCNNQFDPPDPMIATSDEKECERALEDYNVNKSRCPAPLVDCDCESGSGASKQPDGTWVAYRIDTCNDACHPEMLDTSPSASLSLEGTFDRGEYYGPSQEEEDLLNAAWNLLRDNADIVEWLACLVAGPSNGNCVRKRLFDRDDPQRVQFDPNPPLGYEQFTMWTGWMSEHIHINTKTDSDSSYPDTLSDWQAALASGDPTDQACAAARIAKTLLHEMLHGCLGVHNESSDKGDNCDLTYMMANSFKWAMGKRFPCLSAGNGCSDYGTRATWMDD